MDFEPFANGIYANINRGVRRSESGDMEIVERGEFLEEARRAWEQAADKRAEDKLYAGGETRTTLSDAEIAVLRNKYDVRNMSDKQYDAFLDDLEDMGAISRWEKDLLGYNGKVVVAYADENGETVYSDPGFWGTVLPAEGSRPAFRREEAEGDILKWVSDRLSFWKPLGATEEQRKAQRKDLELFEVLSGILSRMAGMQPAKAQESGTADKDEEPGIIDQLADPKSQFYQDMFQRLRVQMELSEEEKKKQAIIDALDSILEGMRSTGGAVKRKDVATSMANLSKEISQLDKDDPRRKELDLFRQRLSQLGIFVDLDLGVKGSKDKGWQTLTQYLIDEENKSIDPSIFDLI